MNASPSVSVIVVNYQRAELLARVLKALEFQRYDNFELIVVSDIAEAERPHSTLPVKWVHYDHPNISAARNRGLAQAAGQIVAFCDDDAVPEFRWLHHLVQPYSDTRIGWAGGFIRGRNGVSFQWRAQTINRRGEDANAVVTTDPWTVFEPDPDRVLNTVGTNCSFRRDAIIALGGFDEAYHYFLDEADMCVRMSDAGWCGAIVPLAEVHHGYAKGPYRRTSRVPKDLTQVAASMAHFLRVHGKDEDFEAAHSAFQAQQHRRVMQFFDAGLLDAVSHAALIASLENGARIGAERVSCMATFDATPNDFAKAHVDVDAPQQKLIAGFFDRARIRRKAKALAAEGVPITVYVPSFTHRNLVVEFSNNGYWIHEFGLLGHAVREDKRRFRTPGRWVACEQLRVGPQRGL